MPIISYKLPRRWHNLIQKEPNLTETYIQGGITVYLLQSMLEKNEYIPKYDPYPIIQRCKFLKLFNYLSFDEVLGIWYRNNKDNRNANAQDITLDPICLYNTMDDVKLGIHSWFDPEEDIETPIDIGFSRFILERYAADHNEEFEHVLIMFYQCGQALHRSLINPMHKLFEIFDCVNGVDALQNWTGVNSGTEFQTMLKYRIRIEFDSVYLFTLNHKCPFDELKGHL